MKKAFNRLLALLLTMLLVVNASGITVFAADTGNELPAGLTAEELQQKNQIIDGWLGAENGVLGGLITDGEWNATTGEKVQVSKTIAPTGTENEFEITLEVKTQEEPQKNIVIPDAAITLVMDVSDSMDQCAICGGPKHDYHEFVDNGPRQDDSFYNFFIESGGEAENYEYSVQGDGKCDYGTKNEEYSYDDYVWYDYCGVEENDHTNHAFGSRIDAAKKSAMEFIKSLKDSLGDATNTRRYVSLVTFADYAKTVLDWVDIATEDGYEQICNAIEGLATGTRGETGGTNICAGLQEATGLMTGTDASVDGENVDISGLDNKYTVLLSDGMPSYYIDDDGTVVGEGMEKDTPTDYKYCSQTAAYANTLKENSGSKLYSICFCEARKVCYTDEEGKETKVVDLLTDMSDACYTAENAKQLHEVFEGIAELLTLLTKAWIVTDPMGSNIEFGRIIKNDKGETQGNEIAEYSDGSLVWDLSNETPISIEEDENRGTKTYTYQLRYKIKLDNLGNDFVKESPYATNGYTDLTYTFLEYKDGKYTRVDENGKPVDSSAALDRIGFNVPQVKGYLGDLTFKKVGPSGEPLAGAEFTLTLNEEGKTWERTATSDENGMVTFTRIPSGHEYTLTEESAPDGYEAIEPLTVKVSYGEVKVEGEGVDTVDGVYTVTDPYALGSLTIKKNVKVDEKGKIDNIIGEGRDFTFTVQADKNLKGKFGKINGEDVEFTDGKAEVTVTVTVGKDGTASGEVTIEDLPVGTYTVTEQDASIEGYDLDVTGEGNVTVVANENGEPSTVTVTNTYTQNLGSLTITKSVVGGGDEAANKTYTFTVTGPDGSSLTAEIKGNGSATIEGLVPGTYTVTEQNADIGGYTLSVDNSGDTAIVEAEKTAEVTVTNTYTEIAGSLLITKNVNGGGADAAGKTYTFDITGPDGYTNTVTITGAGSATLNNLDPGEYTITERDASIDGYDLEVTGDKTATVVADETATASVTNTYTLKLGSLTITKKVEGNYAGAESKEYTFDVTGPNGYTNTVTVTGNGSETLNDLVPGEYTVTEQDADIEGYTLDVSGGGSVTVEADKTAEVTVTNTYTLKLGSLTITKMVDGGGEEAANKTYTFTVTGPNYANTVTLTAGASTTINDLVPGTYTITETDAEIEGYTLKTTGTGDVEVKDKTNTNRTVTNTYTQKLGSLKITKMVSGGGAEAAGKTYTFTIEGPEGSNYFETVTLTAGASETLEGLVPGTYTVTEQDANIDGYTLEVDGTGDVTVEADGNVEVTVTNTYTTVETNPVETDPVETDPVETDPVETDPVETDPVETEPEETEPVETEPEETEPEETEPVETEPVETEPVETEPEETEPVETEPEETEPVETEPVETEPVETEPVETEPEETEPVETDPVETEPEPETEPVIIPETTGPEPVVTEPVETEPVVTEPAETEPETEIPEPDVPLDDISNEPAPAADVPSTEPPYEEIPDPDVPLVDIPDQFVPMTDIPSIEPPYEDIPDADIPLAEEAIPTTGDISRRSLWTGLMSISGLGIMGMIAAILADRKKSKKEDKD